MVDPHILDVANGALACCFPMDERADKSPLDAPRHLTAICRSGLSRPIRAALADGIIAEETTVLDYGCGRGDDVRALRARGVVATGWDPFYANEVEVTPADVVNLGFVLNVIESPDERVATLRRAFCLAKMVLVVAVRVEHGIDAMPGVREGLRTTRGTFQKYYSPSEFVKFVEETLSARAHVAAPGVVYVFRDAAAEHRFVAVRAFARGFEFRADLVRRFRENQNAIEYVEVAKKLGRYPLPDELPGYPRLLEEFGSDARLRSLAGQVLDPAAVAASREARRDDILVFIALLRLQDIAAPKYSALPAAVQADIRTIFGSYARALTDGQELLFSVGSSGAVQDAASECPYGKKLPGYLYVHRSVEDDLHRLLRVLVLAAKRIVGEIEYDVTKIALDGRAVSFLAYPNFDLEGHPSLSRSVRVFLPKATFELIDYSGRANPPVLHRKDALVANTYPRYALFRALTESEERHGVLDAGSIGTKQEWEALLTARGLSVIGHQIVSRGTPNP